MHTKKQNYKNTGKYIRNTTTNTTKQHYKKTKTIQQKAKIQQK